MVERAAVTAWGLSKLTDNKKIIQTSPVAKQAEMPTTNKAQIDRIRQLCKDNKLGKAKVEAKLKTMGLPVDVTKHTVAQLDAFEGDLIGMKTMEDIPF